MAVATVPAASRLFRPPTWIHGRFLDLAMTFCWVPFAILGFVVSGNSGQVEASASAILLLSMSHQPVTLGIVYGDREQFGLRRRVFTWSPLVFLLVVFAGLKLSLLVVALVAAGWNTEHTLMQRYGITRIYRRKGGDTDSGRLDLHMLFSWLAFTLAWVVADPGTGDRIESIGLGATNKRGAEVLVDIRPFATVLVVVAGVYAAFSTLSWLRREIRNGFDANTGVYMYLASTAGLFAVAIVHPIAGLLAWIASHAIEYFIIVSTNLDSRYRRGPTPSAPLGRVVSSPVRGVGVVAVFAVAVVTASKLLNGSVPSVVYGLIFLSVGGLHVFYDGFIWKLRRPQVADSFRIEA
jgi:hypothetical protein